MTPLAHHLVKFLCEPPAKRPIFIRNNSERIRYELSEVHCFELTDALPIIFEASEKIWSLPAEDAEEAMAGFVFLPAPVTWLEWKNPVYGRVGLLLRQESDNRSRASVAVPVQDQDVVITEVGRISNVSADIEWAGAENGVPAIIAMPPVLKGQFEPIEWVKGILAFSHTALVVINTPKIIGRRQHMPHAGLERALRRTFGPGRFPLNGWTEIKLQVSKPVEIDDGEPHEAHLTGRRALHFCRKHIRIRRGQLEYVSVHWRGDPALGMKQSRYAVTP